ncbi:MAG TPA: SAM-dependent methyltransferase [Nocardioidaceae bacterium]|nr:SAM-dependent methyltransferase [Nocardioidaceae bacterium]
MTGPTPLGMPPIPPPTADPPWKKAWDAALYGPGGFFRRESPAAHFRTSVHASPLFARAVVALTRRAGLDTIVDVGAGRGELLAEAHRIDPELMLLGVEVAPRPADLPDPIAWTSALPEAVDGLVIANEWLDNIPCHIVEVDPAGQPRVVHVDPATGRETLGTRLDDRSVPAALAAWCERWWPLEHAAPGVRAEVGTTRDEAWSDVVGRVTRGLALAVDYGHTANERPPLGTVRSYLQGREVDVLPDGSRDVTAHVAVDAVAARVGGSVLRQRDALNRLGVSGARPELAVATSDPQGYVRALSLAGEAAELTEEAGLGGFYWVLSRTGDVPSAAELLQD